MALIVITPFEPCPLLFFTLAEPPAPARVNAISVLGQFAKVFPSIFPLNGLISIAFPPPVPHRWKSVFDIVILVMFSSAE